MSRHFANDSGLRSLPSNRHQLPFFMMITHSFGISMDMRPVRLFIVSFIHRLFGSISSVVRGFMATPPTSKYVRLPYLHLFVAAEHLLVHDDAL
jgi:hypothetical protein